MFIGRHREPCMRVMGVMRVMGAMGRWRPMKMEIGTTGLREIAGNAGFLTVLPYLGHRVTTSQGHRNARLYHWS